MNKITSTILLLFSTLLSFAQAPDEEQKDIRDNALNVYMGASEYVKVEIPYINYVRDLEESDIYIITTITEAGSRGTEYTLYITGQDKYAGMVDTVTFYTNSDSTEDIRRKSMARNLKQALMRYIQKTPLSEYITIDFNRNISSEISTDNWDNWVITPSLSMNFHDTKTSNLSQLNGRLFIDRITEDLKVNIDLNYQKYNSEFKSSDFSSKTEYEEKWVDLAIVKSISDHWSYGAFLSAYNSPHDNIAMAYQAMPGIEYDLYPYSEFLRRQLRIAYWTGYKYEQYEETTILDQTENQEWIHTLSAAYGLVQKWGNLNISLKYTNNLQDWSDNSLDIETNLDIRLTKGLMFFINNSFRFYKTENLSLVFGSTPSISLESGHDTTIRCGLAYTFGSIYNNVVNPRFGSRFF